MIQTSNLPHQITIRSQNLRDTRWAIWCLWCGGGGAPIVVAERRADHPDDARLNALREAEFHAQQHERQRQDVMDAPRRAMQADALQWTQAQADAVHWADMDWLHYDGKVYFKKDMEDPRAGRGRTVAKARVEALIKAGFLQLWDSDWSVVPTRDGRAALRAWYAAQPEPVEKRFESTHLRPLIGGEEEARRDAELAERLVAIEAEKERIRQIEERFGPEPEPAPADPAECDHELVWAYVTTDEITRQLGYHLACACGTAREVYPGRSPAFFAGGAQASPEVAIAFAEQRGYSVTGRWTVVDEHSKRAPIEADDADAVCVFPAVDDPNRRPSAAPAEPQPTAAAEPATAAPTPEQCEQTDISWAGPGIVGPGTRIEYVDMSKRHRRKHGSHGTVVRIGRRCVTWRPRGSRRTLRTPLSEMRVDYCAHEWAPINRDDPRRYRYWYQWTLAEHLRFGRSEEPAQAPEQPAAAEPQQPNERQDVEQLQLTVFEETETAAATVAGPVIIVPCSGAKLTHRAAARDLYTGPYHVACRKAAEALTADGGLVLVLSAKYGLVPLDEEIEPYDMTMDDPEAITGAELQQQARAMGIHDAPQVTILAGAKYTARAQTVWPQAATPLAGRGIGRQKARLAAMARNGEFAIAA
ncbi:hypothetical protein BX261_7252 [Streptomyces sp. 2321.6]|uniref:DUF6884 domain-containing protein n=1 Tax=Streptomyces sp. 2321.6 TaxID=1938840 RepID=UPI000BB0F99C|nr:DUF6884 domain-containing protein [Streptomyces sp. 2321.6]PBC72379.1 hypothetical protein BX261_7252 [Streptomyces sp. 2321.6]